MIKRGLLFVLLSWVLLSGIVHAQDMTPTPNGSLITNTGVDMLLPAAIRFRATFAINRQSFESAALSLYQANGFERTISVNLDENLIGEGLDFVEVQIDQALNTANVPRLFEPLSYRWELITTNGKTYTIAQEYLPVPPNTIGEWQQAGDSPITFYWYNPSLGIDILRGNLLTVYTLLQSQTGLDKTFQFIIFDSDYRFCDTKLDEETGQEISITRGSDTYSCSRESVQALLQQIDLRFIQRADAAFDTLEAQLMHEIVTEFYGSYWTVTVPAWFEEGLALLYRPYPGLRELVVAQQADTRGALIGLPQLQTPLRSGATPEQQDIWKAQSYLLLLYLADTYGAETPFKLALSLDRAESFDAAFEEITGTTLEDMYRSWRIWLQSRQAERAATWNPYLQTTPTVTPTATITLIPPSRTPTNTSTFTLTPTSTSLTGRDRPTVFVAPTTSPTTAPTASNTPLPPGSLPTVVPTATPPVPVDDDSGGGLPCGSAAIILPALVIAARSRWKK